MATTSSSPANKPPARRWNGWGDPAQEYPLPASARDYLSTRLQPEACPEDATLEQVIVQIPASRLPSHPLVNIDPELRLRHARGHSLPDWVALRSGRINTFPDGVAFPTTSQDVQELFTYARQAGALVIPYGGGTSVVGHINPLVDSRPVLTLDMSQMNALTALDETSRLATIGAGASGPQIEAQLNDHGYTLGHFPQSFEYSTLGGWIATRSCGQQSYYYGRLENLFAGGEIVTPEGVVELPPLPASAAGPDLRQFVLGSEGRLGVVTRGTMRVQPCPEVNKFYGAFFHDWESGSAAMKDFAQKGLPISMARLSNALETETTLILSGKERLTGWADRGLNLLGFHQGYCLLIFGVTGPASQAGEILGNARRLIRRHHGLFAGGIPGKLWAQSRYRSPYLRNTLWNLGIAVDTLETAVPWKSVRTCSDAILNGLQQSFEDQGYPGLAFAHLSHLYQDGASIYVTCLFPRAVDPDETLRRWTALKLAGSQAVVSHAGTISHQHGVGLDHLPYLQAEKGELGLDLIQAVRHRADPLGMMNPGKLVEVQDVV